MCVIVSLYECVCIVRENVCVCVRERDGKSVKCVCVFIGFS